MLNQLDADDVEKALLASPRIKSKPPENPMSADRVKWEHIHRVFELCNRNVSETARRLKCIVELCKEFYLKDLLDKVSNFNFSD